MAQRPDLLALYNNEQMVARYRVDHDTFNYLLDLVGTEIGPRTKRSNSLSATEKLLIALRFFATGDHQLTAADGHGVKQSSVSRAITAVVGAFCNDRMIHRFIRFPTTDEELQEARVQFNGLAGFPKVIGAIDGTHLRIKAPSQDEDQFVNRKGFHSINVQLVCDANSLITNIVAKWPGSSHDSRILELSALKDRFEGGDVPAGNHLLGDSGYAAKRWLLTPYNSPAGRAQIAYNRAHKKTRSVVERTIGQWKKRFAVLHNEQRMDAGKVCKIAITCAILHNIFKSRHVDLPMDEPNQGPNDGGDDGGAAAPQVGLRYRDHFASTYF